MTVAPARLDGWLGRFEANHGPCRYAGSDAVVSVEAEDGAVASVEVPFPALPGRREALTAREALVAHVVRERTVGVLLARLGGHAVGVFVGDRLVASKVGSRHVQGRTAAGGWSQQRFARRRAGQAVVAHGAAADVTARILLEHDLDAVVVGGDRSAVDAVLADSRLARLLPLVTGRLLAVPDPRLKVLQECGFRDVWIKVTDPAPG